MMLSEEAILTRNKIIGVLLQQARLDARMSIEACAHVLGSDAALIAKAERGEAGLSLPQLESLAYVLGVPLSYFLQTEELPDLTTGAPTIPYQETMVVRDKIIGALLRLARQEAGQELEKVSAVLGYTPQQLEAVELGQAQISLVELQALADELGMSMESFTADDLLPPAIRESDGPDREWPDHLSPEILDFVLKPINLPYLRIAMNLSEMPADTLRQIASGLLEITY
jgi:transcriptional regulator with XRE-family HTH domain